MRRSRGSLRGKWQRLVERSVHKILAKISPKKLYIVSYIRILGMASDNVPRLEKRKIKNLSRENGGIRGKSRYLTGFFQKYFQISDFVV